MSEEWIDQERQEVARELAAAWTPEARERAWQGICQPLPGGDEPASSGPPPSGLEPPPLSPHGGSLVELASLGHDFAYELEHASSDNPEIAGRLEALRAEFQGWLAQRRQALEQLSHTARELELLQKRVGAEASIARGGAEAVRLRLERWV